MTTCRGLGPEKEGKRCAGHVGTAAVLLPGVQAAGLLGATLKKNPGISGSLGKVNGAEPSD